jgi:hypothetical protein
VRSISRLRLDDINDLEAEPAAQTKIEQEKLIEQLRQNGASDSEIEILLNERVELNAMTSDALIEMIERKLNDYGLQKVIPSDKVLADAYQAFHHSNQLCEAFEEAAEEYEEGKADADVPRDLNQQIRAILDEDHSFRWDDAIQIVLGKEVDDVKTKKQEAKQKSGDFTEDLDDEDE